MRTLTITIISIFLTVSAFATTKELKNTTTIRDNWIGNTLSNLGTADTMVASTSSGAINQKSMLSFANLRDSISGSSEYIVIDTFTLYVKVKSRTIGSAISIFPKMKPDSENVATYSAWGTTLSWGSTGAKTKGTTENTSNGSGADFDSTNIIVDAQSIGTGYQAFDMTAHAQKWINGTSNPLYGIWIAAIGSSTKTVVMYTSENATSSNQPYIHVVYHDSVDTSHKLTPCINDTWLDPGHTGTNYGSDDSLKAQYGPAVSSTKALISFQNLTDSLPANQVFDTVYFHYYVISGTASPEILFFRQANVSYENYSTWNNRYDATLAGSGSDTAWNTAGSQGSSDRYTTGSGVIVNLYAPRTTAGWDSCLITTAFNNWYTGTWNPAAGFELAVGNDEANTRTLYIYSTEAGSLHRPYISYVSHTVSAATNLVGQLINKSQSMDLYKDRLQ